MILDSEFAPEIVVAVADLVHHMPDEIVQRAASAFDVRGVEIALDRLSVPIEQALEVIAMIGDELAHRLPLCVRVLRAGCGSPSPRACPPL